MKGKTKMQKGITLIALIITIVVLLILAEVAISSITGDGILGYAQNATNDYNRAAGDEQDMLQQYVNYLKNHNTGSSNNGGTGDGGGSTPETPTPSIPGATFTDGTFLTWDELRLEENGTKYGYNASAITDTTIGQFAFYECSTLTSIKIPNSVTIIGEYAFRDCGYLTSIEIPDSVTTIGEYAFCDCESLTSIEIPSSVTDIDGWAFCNCQSLSNVTFGANSQLTTIGPAAFAECTSLSTIKIPGSVENIAGEAFAYCTLLTNITFDGTKVQWNDIYKGYWSDYNVPDAYVQCFDGIMCFRCTGGTATCQQLAVCTTCNAEYGSLAEHIGGTATCQRGPICTVCNQEYGWLGEHTGGTATCQQLAVCTTCNQEYGALEEHTGGTATCQQRAVCTTCNQEYGGFGPHSMSNGTCTLCGTNGTVIESEHNPYANDINNVTLGTWDYTEAQSVTITITYQTESTSYDWIYLKSGDNYIDLDGNITENEIKIGDNTKMTATFTTSALTGSVIFTTDGSVNEFYGVYVAVTPNY